MRLVMGEHARRQRAAQHRTRVEVRPKRPLIRLSSTQRRVPVHDLLPKVIVLLRHERVWCGGLRKWVAQHGHRSRLWARATVSLRRMVAMEFGTCRSGRIGGAAGSITGGKVNRLELRAGRS